MPEPQKEIKSTTDHAFIKQWAEERGGTPARVRPFAESSRSERLGGLLRVDFWHDGKNLEGITWSDFFTVLNYNKLTFLYHEDIGNEKSRFYSIIKQKPNHDRTKHPIKEAINTRHP